MSRAAEIAGFLEDAGWGAAVREALAGDASTRAYERLTLKGATAILMDQPPKAETAPCPPDATPAERAALGYNASARLAAGRVDAFVATARFIEDQGLSAPHIIAAAPEAGLALIEDLGDGIYARLLEQGADENALYDAAIDALVRLQQAAVPDVLPGGWPLLSYDTVALQTAEGILIEWLPPFLKRPAFSAEAQADWAALWAPIRARGDAGANVFCHRDYHAENLIWLPQRDGAARVGMLDFQDAVKAHPAWDLSMLLHDARRDISPDLHDRCMARYLDQAQPVDAADFLRDFHALGALNIVRIIGIFARLVTRDGKPRYAAFMPRLWRYLDHCLTDPSLHALADWMTTHLPKDARA